METVLSVRSIGAGALALIVSSMSLAEPAKPSPSATLKNGAAPVVLASAEIDHTAVGSEERPASDSTQPPKKKRAARVTTCRCGDQTADPSQE